MIGDYIQLEGNNPQLITTEEQANKYTIFDIVIPLVGRDTDHNLDSTALVTSIAVLEEEDLVLEDFEHHCQRLFKEFYTLWLFS